MRLILASRAAPSLGLWLRNYGATRLTVSPTPIRTWQAALPPDFTANDFDISADGSDLIVDKVENNPDMALIERSGYNFTLAR